MENINSNEVLSFERDLKGCQIEHIMPQTLPPDGWPISKENHERYLHTLGNLSITFDNQGLRNKPFHEKREMLRQRSRIRLNNLLLDYEKFDEIAIRGRSLGLLDMFVNAYGVPDCEVGETSGDNEVNIFEADDPTRQKLQYAIFLDKKLNVKEVSKLYIEVFKQLFKMNSEIFFTSEIGTQIKLSDDSERARVINPVAINDTYFIETCFNNRNKFERIKNALSVFALEDKLLIKYAQLIDSDKLLRELETYSDN